MKYLALVIFQIIVSIAAIKDHTGKVKRELVRDLDNDKLCFDLNYNQGYADYALDPFKANEDRGDWGKCMNGQLFGAM